MPEDPRGECKPGCLCEKCLVLRGFVKAHPVETCPCGTCQEARGKMEHFIAMEVKARTGHPLPCSCVVCEREKKEERIRRGLLPRRDTVVLPPPAELLDEMIAVSIDEHQFSLANLKAEKFQLEVSVRPVYGRPEDGWGVTVRYSHPRPDEQGKPAWVQVMTPVAYEGGLSQAYWTLALSKTGKPGLGPLHGGAPTRPDPCWEQELWDLIALAVLEKTGWHPGRMRGLEPFDGPVVTPAGVTLQRLVSTSLRAQELACLLRQCEDFLMQRIGQESKLLAQKIHNTLLTL